ncbi:MAG: metal ABC transporter solute-binding protein, Zn/Mn family [Bacillus sp. (in: firmicutes)]
MKSKLLLSLFLVVSLFLTACGDTEKSSNNTADTLTVYTTVYPLQFLAEEIGGDYVDAESIYPPGANEHTYEPSQKDIIEMTDSDLFLYIGYNLEGFVTSSKSVLEDEGVPVIAIGENAVEEHEHADENHESEKATTEDEHDHESEEATTEDEHDHDHGDVDPHLWLDPHLMIDMAEQVTHELVALKPEQEEYFEANFEALKTKLNTLDEEFAEIIANSTKKEIIVSHAAYGYWESRYGIEQIAVTGLTNSSEPSQKELENIMKTAEEHDIHYVLFEQNVSSKLTETIQKEIGAKALTLHNLSVLTDKDIENGEDYFSLMESNLETLKTALN